MHVAQEEFPPAQTARCQNHQGGNPLLRLPTTSQATTVVQSRSLRAAVGTQAGRPAPNVQPQATCSVAHESRGQRHHQEVWPTAVP